MSDVDDEELAALREAALASLEKSSSSNSSVVPSGSKNVAPISTVMASSSYSSYNTGDQSNYSNQYSWRNQPPNNRRGRGGGRPFPKVNQRSNLIVITPVAPEEKNADKKGSTSQLVLPQHKWCQSINEDSSSPRSFKKTGPTRFNRHESDSDSSDSEPEELSDNDSYSNETILQDEPSDHYGTRSGRSVSRNSTPEKSIIERRLSFQNIDPAHNSFPNRESTSVYKCLKNTYQNSSDKRLEVRSPSVENDTDHSWKRRTERTLPYMPSDNVSDNKCASHAENSSKTQTVNGESSHKRKLSNAEGKHCSQTETFHDGSLSPQSRRAGGLSKNDLRLELKKRMQEMTQNLQARGSERARRSSHSPTSRSRSNRRRSHSRSTNGHRSQSLGRRRSPSKDRRRHRRSSDYSLKKEHSPSPGLDHSKKEPIHSPHCNPKRSSSSSSDRSSKDRSRSPRHRFRRNRSSSSDRSRKSRSRSPLLKNKRVDSPVSDVCQRNKSRSPRRNHKRVDSPASVSPRNRSRSPRRNHKRVDSPVSDISRRNRSRSPRHNHKRGDSPASVSLRNRSRSPRRNHKSDDSPASVSQRNRSRSPRRNHKSDDSPASVSQRNRSRSPRHNHKRDDSPASVGLKNRCHSPRQSQKRANSPTSVSPRNRSRSPNRKHRRDRSSSSDHSKKDRSRSPSKNHKRQHSWSSDDRQDRSPSNRNKRGRSPSPVYSRRDSNKGRRHGRHRDHSSTSTESSGSSRHSSSVGRLRSVSSVVNKPVSVVSKVDVRERTVSSESDSQYEKNKLDRAKPFVSSAKSSVESKSSASDGQKRVPVHMRLGTLPGKRVIQMTKDVEAAFVNTSSDEGGDEANGRHKKDNLHVMYKANDGKNDESSKRHVHRNVVQSDTFKEGRFKHRR